MKYACSCPLHPGSSIPAADARRILAPVLETKNYEYLNHRGRQNLFYHLTNGETRRQTKVTDIALWVGHIAWITHGRWGRMILQWRSCMESAMQEGPHRWEDDLKKVARTRWVWVHKAGCSGNLWGRPMLCTRRSMKMILTVRK